MPDEKENAVCPCCGEKTLKRPVKVDGKIVDDYLASIMTGIPFSHTFNMFDGRLKITCGLSDRDTGLMFWRFIHFIEAAGIRTRCTRPAKSLRQPAGSSWMNGNSSL